MHENKWRLKMKTRDRRDHEEIRTLRETQDGRVEWRGVTGEGEKRGSGREEEKRRRGEQEKGVVEVSW